MTEHTHALKPCPFCGSSASLIDERLLFVVRCGNCGAVALGDRIEEPDDGDPEPDWQEMRRSAVMAWNTRTGSKPAAGPTRRQVMMLAADMELNDLDGSTRFALEVLRRWGHQNTS